MAKHAIDKLDLGMARRIAANNGPRGDSDLESAAMKGLLEAATTWHGRGSWRSFAYARCLRRVQDEVRAKRARHEDPTAPEDLHETAIDNTNVIDLLASISASKAVKADLAAGLIDMRRTDHQTAINQLKETLS